MYKIHYCEKNAAEELSKELYKYIKGKENLVILCIGTDKSAGDSLGPFVGKFLKEKRISNVYGTLKSPISAKILTKTTELIKKEYSNPYIIAIDASLNNSEDCLENIIIRDEPIKPGGPVGENFDGVGDVCVIGTIGINSAGTGLSNLLNNAMIVQSASLFMVYSMAIIISDAVAAAVEKSREDIFNAKG